MGPVVGDAVGQAAHNRWASSPTLFMAAPATNPGVLRARIRPCRVSRRAPELESEGGWCAASGWTCIAISRDRDRRERPGPLGRSDSDQRRGAGRLRAESGARRSGGAGGDQWQRQDRRCAARPGRAGRGGQHAQASGDQSGQDRPHGRTHASLVAGGGSAGCGVDAGRADPRAASPHRATCAAGEGQDPSEEPGPRRAGPQSVRPATGHAPVQQGRPSLARRSGVARR
jgi:hypothetical protein